MLIPNGMLSRRALRPAMLAPILALLFAASSSAKPGDPLLTYGVDLVSDYVSRGTSTHQETFPKDGTKVETFAVLPAAQPSVTLTGAGGFSLGLWSSVALVERGADDRINGKGLSQADEVDFTLSWAWDNKLGSFSAGIVNYANVPATTSWNEVFVVWSPPFARALSPKLSHYSDIVTALTYTSLTVGGGEKLTWSANLGYGQAAALSDSSGLEVRRGVAGIQDLTVKVGYGLSDALSVSLGAALRPNPAVASGLYDVKGKYKVDSTDTPAPPLLMWLTLSYAGGVTE
ncbi:MAG: hypothetical protein HY423_10030 [Candidatus Lambdaproteobacteria bacterium]|nr:hypothetical protein [Candidatus Lambdaproteobacteria bacterium]